MNKQNYNWNRVVKLEIQVRLLEDALINQIKINNADQYSRRNNVEHVYMSSEMNSNRFEISNCFEKTFRLHGNFTMANLDNSNPFQKLFRLHDDFTVPTF